MANFKTVTGAEFGAEVSSNAQVLVEFGASWCQPCKAMKPVLEKMASKGTVALYVDIDDSEDVAKKFGIKGAPTFIAFRDGKETGRCSGMQSEAALAKLMKR